MPVHVNIPMSLKRTIIECAQQPWKLQRESAHHGGERDGPDEGYAVHVEKLQLGGDEVEVDILGEGPHLEVHDLSFQKRRLRDAAPWSAGIAGKRRLNGGGD